MPPLKPPTLTLPRSFTSSAPHCKPAADPYRNRMPPYPYGPALQYKQSNSGLYGGSTIQFGNLISSKNSLKSRRSWHPNIHRKRLWSDSLQKFIQVRVQARVLRTIDKVGGLDEYLLGDKPARIRELGVEGWRLRWKVMRTGKVKERIRAERFKLGLPAEGWRESIDLVQKDGVEEEVERVSGSIIEQMDADHSDKVHAPSPTEEGEIAVDEGQQRQEIEGERISRTAGDDESWQPPQSKNTQNSREMKIPRLVGLSKAPTQTTEETSTEKDLYQKQSNIVQANDSTSVTGRAMDRLKGLFGR